MKLHEAKMKCFTGLSKGTTESEKMEFIEYDLATEIERMEEKEGDCVISAGSGNDTVCDAAREIK